VARAPDLKKLFENQNTSASEVQTLIPALPPSAFER